jgi:hypothetical protein
MHWSLSSNDSGYICAQTMIRINKKHKIVAASLPKVLRAFPCWTTTMQRKNLQIMKTSEVNSFRSQNNYSIEVPYRLSCCFQLAVKSLRKIQVPKCSFVSEKFIPLCLCNSRNILIFIFSHRAQLRLLCIRQRLHVSAFYVGHHQATHYIKHKHLYREILFASSQI